jgi:hypothetical protein
VQLLLLCSNVLSKTKPNSLLSRKRCTANQSKRMQATSMASVKHDA